MRLLDPHKTPGRRRSPGAARRCSVDRARWPSLVPVCDLPNPWSARYVDPSNQCSATNARKEGIG